MQYTSSVTQPPVTACTPAPNTFYEINAQTYATLVHRIQQINALNPESVFAMQALSKPTFCATADSFFAFQTYDGELVTFAVNQSTPRLPFYEFIHPQRLKPYEADVKAKVKAIHFTEGADLELALHTFAQNVLGDKACALSFNADCIPLAHALNQMGSLCTHIAQAPSVGKTRTSLKDFTISFVASLQGFHSDFFRPATWMAPSKLNEHLEEKHISAAQFLEEEAARVKTVWNLSSTKKYLHHTRQQLGINSDTHKHLEIGAGFFPDFHLLLEELRPQGTVTIIEREQNILSEFKNRLPKEVPWVRISLLDPSDLTTAYPERYANRFDSIRIVDFFDAIPEQNLIQFARNVHTLLKPGGKLVIAEKDLSRLFAFDSVGSKINRDCTLFRELFGLTCDPLPEGNLEQAFTQANFIPVSNQTILTRQIKADQLPTFLNWTRLDNFDALGKQRAGAQRDVTYQYDIQELVFTKAA